MNKKIITGGLLISCLLFCASCGKEEDSQSSVELKDVGTGLAFEECTVEPDIPEVQNETLTAPVAEDIENHTKTVVKLIKDASVYAKPSRDAARIGSVAKDGEIGVFEIVDGGQWCTVDYNGRVGYILAECLQVEALQPPGNVTPPQDNNGTTNPPTDGNGGNGGNDGTPNGGNDGTPNGGNDDTPNGGNDDTPNGGNDDTPNGGNDDTPNGGNDDTPSGGDDDATGGEDTPDDETDPGNDDTSDGDEDIIEGGVYFYEESINHSYSRRISF